MTSRKIPRFEAKSLPLIPGEYPEPFHLPFESGTFIKLYEYKMPGLKTNILFDPYFIELVFCFQA
jgi:hypothetical protein